MSTARGNWMPARNRRRAGRTVESPRLLVVAHLVVAERKVVQTFPAPPRLRAIDVCVAQYQHIDFAVACTRCE